MQMREITSSPRLPRYWLARLYFGCVMVFTCAASCMEPDSMVYRIADRSHGEGWAVLGGLTFAGSVAILDVLINDFLPVRFTFPWAKRWRHLVFMPMAIGLVMLCYVIAATEGWTPLILIFGMHAVFAVLIAFFDLFARHRSPA